VSTSGKRLSLVRHANADQEGDVRDFERPLSRKGHGEAMEMARRFQERGLVPDLILSSAAVRTRETAETFARVLGVAPRLLQADDSLYLADGDHILATIRAVGPRVTHLMLIGHNRGSPPPPSPLPRKPSATTFPPAALSR
jgi:phosphohistidine phosphatase